MSSRMYAGYIVISGKPNGDVDYHGPFQTESRAYDYGSKLEGRWHTAPLIVPHCSKVTVETLFKDAS